MVGICQPIYQLDFRMAIRRLWKSAQSVDTQRSPHTAAMSHASGALESESIRLGVYGRTAASYALQPMVKHMTQSAMIETARMKLLKEERKHAGNSWERKHEGKKA